MNITSDPDWLSSHLGNPSRSFGWIGTVELLATETETPAH